MIDYDEEIHDELAQKVADLYASNPTLTTNLVASQTDSTVQDVAFVLDSYEVVDGMPVYVGPGRGHGWIEESERVKLVTGFDAPQIVHEDIGNRWPDGSLRDVPFDIENNEHRTEFNLPPLEPAVK